MAQCIEAGALFLAGAKFSCFFGRDFYPGEYLCAHDGSGHAMGGAKWMSVEVAEQRSGWGCALKVYPLALRSLHPCTG